MPSNMSKSLLSLLFATPLLISNAAAETGAKVNTVKVSDVKAGEPFTIPQQNPAPYFPAKIKDPGLNISEPEIKPVINVPVANIPLKENPCALRVTYWDSLQHGNRVVLRGCLYRYWAANYDKDNRASGNMLPQSLYDNPDILNEEAPPVGANPLDIHLPSSLMSSALCLFQMKAAEGRVVNLYSRNAQQCEAAATALATRMPIEASAMSNIALEDLGFDEHGVGFIAGPPQPNKELNGGTFKIGIQDFE